MFSLNDLRSEHAIWQADKGLESTSDVKARESRPVRNGERVYDWESRDEAFFQCLVSEAWTRNERTVRETGGGFLFFFFSVDLVLFPAYMWT